MLVHCFLVSFLSLLRFEMKKNSLQSFKDERNENYRKTKTRNEENKKKMLEHQQEEREQSNEDMLPTKKLNCFQ